MKQKLELDTQKLSDWMNDNWTLYSSQMYMEKLLRLHLNSKGMYKVTYGEDIIYHGSQMTHAIAAWESV